MKKIIFFIDHFLPGYKFGGPVKSLSNLINSINRNYSSYVFTKNRDFNESKPYKNIKFGPINKNNRVKVYYEPNFSFYRILKFIYSTKPDFIWLNSYFSILSIKVLIISKFISLNKPIVLSVRGELSQKSLSFKSYKKRLYIGFFGVFLNSPKIIFHVTSIDEKKCVKDLFPEAEIFQIPNIPNVPKKYNMPLFKKNYLRVIYLSRITPKKNLLFALKILMNKNINVHKIVFDIYGTIEDPVYFKKCLAVMKNQPKNIQIKYRGEIKPSNVYTTLINYNCFFLPTYNENYGHSIVEAMQVGLVPLISDQTPWFFKHRLDGGFSINLNNKDKFIDSINWLGSLTPNEYKKISINSMKYISKKNDPSLAIKSYNDFLTKLGN